MDEITKKLAAIEQQLTTLRKVFDENCRSEVHNLGVLEKRIDDKIKEATNKIIDAIKAKK